MLWVGVAGLDRELGFLVLEKIGSNQTALISGFDQIIGWWKAEEERIDLKSAVKIDLLMGDKGEPLLA